MGIFTKFSSHASGTNDPPEVRNWRIHFIALVSSMSALAMGYDTAVIGGTMALDSFIRDFSLSRDDSSSRNLVQANIVSTFQAGCFFGALFSFPFAEKFGRKKVIMVSALVFLIGGTLMTAAQGRLSLIYAGRAIAGLGIGCSSLVVPVYISETAPPSIRGRLIGIFEIASQGGGMLGFWINYATDRTINVERQAQWVVPLAIQLIPGVGLFFGMFLCPESPRWLARARDIPAAEAIIVNIRGLPADHPYVQTEMAEIIEQLERRRMSELNSMTFVERSKANVSRLFEKGTRNRLGIGMALMFLQSFTGVNIITYYAPRIFESLGVTGTSTRLFSTGFYGIAKTLGMCLFTFWVVESVGRRKGLLWGAALGCIPMWYIGGYSAVADPVSAAADALAAGTSVSRDGWGYLAIVCVYINAVIICATWQGITWTYASEIFPVDVRMLCVSLTTATTWLGSFAIARSTPYMISDLGYGAFFFFGAVLSLMGVWAFFLVPETKGVTLEQMDALFARPVAVTVWRQLRKKPIDLDSIDSSDKGRSSDDHDTEKAGGRAVHLEQTNQKE